MLKGSVVTLVAQLARGLVQIVGTFALARLVAPEDYGLFGLTAVVLNLISMFQEAGLTTATIQREDLQEEQINSLFWINIGLSAALAAALVVIAPGIAWFYEEPRLTRLLWAMTAALFINGARLQHRALLRREMDFVSVAKSDLGSAAVGIAAAVGMGALGWGYWALAGQQLVFALAASASTWWLCAWRPGAPRVVDSAREMIQFGKNLTGYNFVNYFARNTDDYLVYYYHGAAQLGFYAKAYELLRMPLQYINAPLTAVAIPALSRLSSDPTEYRRLFLRIYDKIALLSMPLGAFMIANARDLVVVMLGERWEPSAEIFGWLGLLVFIQPVANATGWLFITQDRSGEMLRWGVMGSFMAVVAIAGGVPWGATGVAAAYAVTGVTLRMPLLFWYVGRHGHVRTRDLWVGALPSAACGVASFAAMWALARYVPIGHVALRLLAMSALGLATFTLTALILPWTRASLGDVRALADDVRAAIAQRTAR